MNRQMSLLLFFIFPNFFWSLDCFKFDKAHFFKNSPSYSGVLCCCLQDWPLRLTCVVFQFWNTAISHDCFWQQGAFAVLCKWLLWPGLKGHGLFASWCLLVATQKVRFKNDLSQRHHCQLSFYKVGNMVKPPCTTTSSKQPPGSCQQSLFQNTKIFSVKSLQSEPFCRWPPLVSTHDHFLSWQFWNFLQLFLTSGYLTRFKPE